MDKKEILQKWNQKQIYWFIEAVIHAIDADKTLAPTEMEYLSDLFYYVEDRNEKLRLRKLIEAEERDALQPPPASLSKKFLAWAFTEIGTLMVSDYDYDKEEEEFLANLASLMGLSEKFIKFLLQWTLMGNVWQQRRLRLMGIEVNEGDEISFDVPIADFDASQRTWYAQVLVTAIVIDGKVEAHELEIIESLLVFLENAVEKENLIKYVKRKVRPTLYAPKGLSELNLKLVFFEVISHFVTHNQFQDKEKIFIRQLSKIILLSDSTYDEAMKWWEDGIQWRKKVPTLIHNAQ